MALTQYSENLNGNSEINELTVNKWFKNKGFTLVDFENRKSGSYTDGIYVSIKENELFKTYCKEDIYGSLLIFEVKTTYNRFECICYTPILLFGFFNMKASFKQKASAVSKYRQHGYEYLEELKEFIRGGN